MVGTIEAPTALRKTAFGGGLGPTGWFWFCCSVTGGAFCLTGGKAENGCGKTGASTSTGGAELPGI